MRAERLHSQRHDQRGVILIEAMVAILIFSLGVLGLVALGGRAVGAQSDAQYRTDAASLTDAIAGQIALGVDRSASGVNVASTLANFAHQPGGGNCVFSGAVANVAAGSPVQALLDRAANATSMPGLPGAGTAQQQILVQNAPGAFNRVEITLCWKTANDNGAWRKHTYVTYVNGSY